MVPDGDLFKAISAGLVSVMTDHIETFTERGLLLRSGTELDADIIVTATGLELLFLGGISVQVDGEAVDAHSRLTYKGMMLEDVPNLALAIGYTNASWTLKCDLTCDYVCRLLNHRRSRGHRQCTPRNTDGSVASGSLLGLSSGYIERGAHVLPRPGSKPPWMVRQSYLSDYRTIKLGAIDDSVMEFIDGATGPLIAAGATTPRYRRRSVW
jgi:cation diffusion facilitator CzcD-associated flavoprotein CzcO